MAKQLDTEAIIEQLQGLEDAIVAKTVAEIIETLIDFAKDSSGAVAEHEQAGIEAAIEIIRGNYQPAK